MGWENRFTVIFCTKKEFTKNQFELFKKKVTKSKKVDGYMMGGNLRIQELNEDSKCLKDLKDLKSNYKG